MGGSGLDKILAIGSAIFILGIAIYLTSIISSVSENNTEEAQNKTEEMKKYVINETYASILFLIILVVLGIILAFLALWYKSE